MFKRIKSYFDKWGQPTETPKPNDLDPAKYSIWNDSYYKEQRAKMQSSLDIESDSWESLFDESDPWEDLNDTLWFEDISKRKKPTHMILTPILSEPQNLPFIKEFKAKCSKFVKEEILWNKVIITGSLLASEINGFSPGDVDIYFKEVDARDKFIKLITEDSMIPGGKITHIIKGVNDGTGNYIPGNEQEFNEYLSVTEHDAVKIKKAGKNVRPLQFILFKTGEGPYLTSLFDMTLAQWYYDSETDTLAIDPRCWMDNVEKTMTPLRATNIIHWERYKKYKERGYCIKKNVKVKYLEEVLDVTPGSNRDNISYLEQRFKDAKVKQSEYDLI